MPVSNLPACHRCGGTPAFQWPRKATEAEAAAQRAEWARLQGGRQLPEEELLRRYGPPQMPVTGCAVHHLGDDPDDPDSGLDRRALMHAADCGGHGVCACLPPAPDTT